MRRLPGRARPVLPVGLLVVAACYSYAPVEFQAAPAGESVRVELSPAGSEWIRMRFGEQATGVQGTVSGTSDTELSLETMHLLGVARPSEDLDRRIDLDRSHVAVLEFQRFDRGKTALAVGGVVMAVGLSFYLAEVVSGGDQGRGSPNVEFSIGPWLSRLGQSLGPW